MINDFYKKLVDLYAGEELDEELEAELRAAARLNADLAGEMYSLRDTVDALKADNQVEFTEESYQRILLKIYALGVEIQPKTPTPSYLQYQLPIQG